MLLNDKSAISCVIICSTGCDTLASVTIKPSMVAIFGWIMPAPLAMPVARTVWFWPILASRLAALGTVSVVMMARAASLQCAAFTPGRARVIFCAGKGSRITPVEKGSTCSMSQPTCAATAAHTASASSRPCAPVPALALPVLITSARMPFSLVKCCLAMCTGAAQKRFWVNTAPTLLALLSTISVKSLWSGFFTPAWPINTCAPSTVKISAASFSRKFTAIYCSFFSARTSLACSAYSSCTRCRKRAAAAW